MKLRFKPLATAVSAASLVLFMPSCEKRSTGEEVKDAVNDALDRRPGEPVRDAAEDAADAVKDAAKDTKDAIKDAAEDVKDATR